MLPSALLLLTATVASSQGLEALEQRLARTPPVSTDFVEYRFSHLLKKPLQPTYRLLLKHRSPPQRSRLTPMRRVRKSTSSPFDGRASTRVATSSDASGAPSTRTTTTVALSWSTAPFCVTAAISPSAISSGVDWRKR